jgi:hypothetical protein
MTTRYYARSRYALDEEAGAEQLRKMLDDDDLDLGDLIAACIEHGPESKQQEVYDAVRSLSEDNRGPRSWARDRLERRSLSRDMRDRRARDRRMGRDLDEPYADRFSGRGREEPIENFRRSEADKEIREAGGQDRCRMGADGFAMDGVLRYIQGG